MPSDSFKNGVLPGKKKNTETIRVKTVKIMEKDKRVGPAPKLGQHPKT